VIVAYWPTWSALWRPHGYLVTLLALYLLYSARHRVASAATKPQPWALLLLIPCSIACVLVWRSEIEGLQLLMLPLLVLVAVLAAFGMAVTRVVALPIAFLYFAAPAWNVVLTPLMQSLTVWVIRTLAPILRLPASFQGNLISFQGGITFVVTPACGGVSFLVQGLAIAMLLGELEQAGLGRRLKLLSTMVLVALITNWIRVLLIVELGYSSGMRNTLATTNHVAFGYLLFVMALAAYLWIATRLPSMEPAGETAALTNASAWRPGVAYAVVVVVLASLPALVALVTRTGGHPAFAGDSRAKGFAQSITAKDPRS
jgi:exosortase